MEAFTFRFLTLRIVSDLTGLSEHTLRQWEKQGILSAGRGRAQRAPRARSRATRLYSWREVEQVQRAAHLVQGGRRPIAEVKRLLEQSRPDSLDREWVIDRRRSAGIRRRRAVGARYAASKRTRAPSRKMR